MLLLKLHGSVNWRVKKGQPKPYGFDAILHHEEWWQFGGAAVPYYGGPKLGPNDIEPYLEPSSFMVPPVLTKSELTEQPVLRIVWTQAQDILFNSEQVVFIGYSLPITDIAATTLFRESLAHLKPSDIKVVDYAESGREKEKREQLLSAYRNVFPEISETQIYLKGGLEWVKEFLG